MKRLVIALAVVACAAPASASAQQPNVVVAPGGGTPGTSSNFELVGHAPLFNRGMNSALAVFDHYVYVGNRTDGSPGHARPGVQIVDVRRPRQPKVVGEMGPPHAGLVGITTRELRVWPEKQLLMIMSFHCSARIHACPTGDDDAEHPPSKIAFYDLADPVHPRLLSTYIPTSKAGRQLVSHEMYLWVDPKDPDRALLYLTTPTQSVDTTIPGLVVADISAVPSGGAATHVAEGNWVNRFPGAEDPANYDENLYLHSIGLTADGTTAYLPYMAGHFLVLDTSDLAAGVENPRMRLVTDPLNRPTWPRPATGHSGVEVLGRPFAFTTDETYSKYFNEAHGCPWGWARLIDVRAPARPQIVSEYKITQNDAPFCGSPADDPATEQGTTFTSHNPTLTRNLAFVSWHSGGLQAIDIANPARPRQAGWFSPAPLAEVATEDPAIGQGPNKVAMWSYPVIKDGLIYVVDLRNGLYILRYRGPRAGTVRRVGFLEGNSNVGDTVRLSGATSPSASGARTARR